MNAVTKKNTGSYYTCNTIADYIAHWAIDNPNMKILEPSFGDGIFINSALSRFAELDVRTSNECLNVFPVQVVISQTEDWLTRISRGFTVWQEYDCRI